MDQSRLLHSSGTQISQAAAAKSYKIHLQKSDLSPVSLFNSLFTVTSKTSEVKVRCVKFLLQALPLKSYHIVNEHGIMSLTSVFLT